MKLNLAKITQKYVGAPYKLGGRSISGGFDCYSLLDTVAREEYGFELPIKMGEYNPENYVNLWQEDKDKCVRIFIKYIASITDKIKLGFNKAGDILIVRVNDVFIIGLQVGQDMLFSAFTDIGVNVTSLRSYTIEGIYRWASPHK